MLTIFRSRAFLASFFITLLLIAFVFGLFTVDARGRQLSFNDTAPAFEVLYLPDGRALLQVNAFSIDRRFNITGPVKLWHFVADFFCIFRSKANNRGCQYILPHNAASHTVVAEGRAARCFHQEREAVACAEVAATCRTTGRRSKPGIEMTAKAKALTLLNGQQCHLHCKLCHDCRVI